MPKIAEGSLHLTLEAKELTAQIKAAKDKNAAEIADMAHKINGTGPYKPKPMKRELRWWEEVAKKWKEMSELGKGMFVFGAVAGGVALVAAAVAAAVDGVIKGFQALAAKANDLKSRVQDGTLELSRTQAKGVALATKSFERIAKVWDVYSAKMVTAWAPLTNMLAEAFETFVPIITPIFEWMIEQFTQAVSIVATLGDAIHAALGGQILQNLPRAIELVTNFVDLQKFSVFQFKLIGNIVGYAWDAHRAAVGGLIVALGHLIKALSSVFTKFLDLGGMINSMPDWMKTDQLKQLAFGLNLVSGVVGNLGEDMIAFGMKEIKAFGSSARALSWMVDMFFDHAKQRREKALKETEALSAKFEYKAIGAVDFGSAEMASIKAKFTTEGLLSKAGQEVAKRHLEETKRTNRLLGEGNAIMQRAPKIVWQLI